MTNKNEQRGPQEALLALATATTQYYEARPDRLEQARVQYQQALYEFNAAQPAADPENTA
jgi:hypothetical protein